MYGLYDPVSILSAWYLPLSSNGHSRQKKVLPCVGLFSRMPCFFLPFVFHFPALSSSPLTSPRSPSQIHSCPKTTNVGEKVYTEMDTVSMIRPCRVSSLSVCSHKMICKKKYDRNQNRGRSRASLPDLLSWTSRILSFLTSVMSRYAVGVCRRCMS